jgi:hypothetical protein
LEANYSLRPPQLDSIEIVSGLPRSLIDILATVDADDASEASFWNWPGAPGSLLQCHLWEAYRLAGILTIRHAQLHTPRRSQDAPSPTADSGSEGSGCGEKATFASTEVIVTRIVSHLDAITRASVAPDAPKDSLISNAIDYPGFVAGLQVDILNEKADLKNAIRSCFAARKGSLDHSERSFHLLEILEEWWTCAGGSTTIHDLARSRGLEIGLL